MLFNYIICKLCAYLACETTHIVRCLHSYICIYSYKLYTLCGVREYFSSPWYIYRRAGACSRRFWFFPWENMFCHSETIRPDGFYEKPLFYIKPLIVILSRSSLTDLLRICKLKAVLSFWDKPLVLSYEESQRDINWWDSSRDCLCGQRSEWHIMLFYFFFLREGKNCSPLCYEALCPSKIAGQGRAEWHELLCVKFYAYSY